MALRIASVASPLGLANTHLAISEGRVHRHLICLLRPEHTKRTGEIPRRGPHGFHVPTDLSYFSESIQAHHHSLRASGYAPFPVFLQDASVDGTQQLTRTSLNNCLIEHPIISCLRAALVHGS